MKSDRKDIIRLKKSISAGLNEILILLIFENSVGALHGYKIAKIFRKQWNIRIGVNTIYTILKKLETRGYIHGRWVQSRSGTIQKQYVITEAGSKYLEQALASIIPYLKAIARLRRRYARRL